MTVMKCDLCGKEVRKGTGVRVGAGDNPFSGSYELCATCGRPIKTFWEKIEKKFNARKNNSVRNRKK